VDSRSVGHLPRAAPERELDPEREVRARAWRFVFDCYEKKKAGGGIAGEEAKGEKDEVRPNRNVP
jgi:hypothetical protein